MYLFLPVLKKVIYAAVCLSDESNYFDVSKSVVTSTYHRSTYDIIFLCFDKCIYDN